MHDTTILGEPIFQNPQCVAFICDTFEVCLRERSFRLNFLHEFALTLCGW
jgi:hypothetical protein